MQVQTAKFGTWVVHDMTDNVTRNRTVEARATGDSKSAAAILKIVCSRGQPALSLLTARRWQPQFVVASIRGDKDAFPEDDRMMLVWERDNIDDPHTITLHTDLAELGNDLGNGALEIVTYTDDGDEDFRFDVARTPEIISRVRQHCKPD